MFWDLVARLWGKVEVHFWSLGWAFGGPVGLMPGAYCGSENESRIKEKSLENLCQNGPDDEK